MYKRPHTVIHGGEQVLMNLMGEAEPWVMLSIFNVHDCAPSRVMNLRGVSEPWVRVEHIQWTWLGSESSDESEWCIWALSSYWEHPMDMVRLWVEWWVWGTYLSLEFVFSISNGRGCALSRASSFHSRSQHSVMCDCGLRGVIVTRRYRGCVCMFSYRHITKDIHQDRKGKGQGHRQRHLYVTAITFGCDFHCKKETRGYSRCDSCIVNTIPIQSYRSYPHLCMYLCHVMLVFTKIE
jgi:hypothetical protein